MEYQYTYLIGGLILLIIWLILFLWRKDTRKEMGIISVIFGIAALLTALVYIRDWWTPLTITKTIVGIEDFLFGFATGGIASVIYEVIFKKRIKIKESNKKQKIKKNLNFLFIGLLVIVLFFGSFFILNLNSFYASMLALTIPLLIIWIKRKDLIKNSLMSGILLVIIIFIAFSISEYLTPGWVESTWHFTNISKFIILSSPLEDLIWAFLAGAFIGPLYEYWKEGKLINIKNSK